MTLQGAIVGSAAAVGAASLINSGPILEHEGTNACPSVVTR